MFHIKYLTKILNLDSKIYLEFSILDLTKLLIYKFHCKYIKIKFRSNLFFTGTDSLVFQIETDDIYEDFYED